jgi:hypothetical protein
MAYTTETRGAWKKLLPTCRQPSAEEVARAQAHYKKQNGIQAANEKKANDENDAIDGRAQGVITGKKPQTLEERTINRCLTSGRLPAAWLYSLAMLNILSPPSFFMLKRSAWLPSRCLLSD